MPSSNRISCAIFGVLCTALSILLLLGGFILLIVFSSDFDRMKDWSVEYGVGIAAISVGTVTSILATLYVCIALRNGWEVYGCIQLKTPSKLLTPSLTQLPSKDELDNGAGGEASSSSRSDYAMQEKQPTQRMNAYDLQTHDSRTNKPETEWDPESILKDDDMY